MRTFEKSSNCYRSAFQLNKQFSCRAIVYMFDIKSPRLIRIVHNLVHIDRFFGGISKERSYATSKRVKSPVSPRRERREIGKRLRNTRRGLKREVGGGAERVG